MFKRLLRLCLLLLLIIIILYATEASAQESWILPYADVSYQYDDNIFLQRDNEEEDWITVFSPGILIEPKTDQHKFRLNYRADLKFFQDHSDETNYNHTLMGEAEFNFNKARLHFIDMFRSLKDRDRIGAEEIAEASSIEGENFAVERYQIGSDDISRVQRTQNYFNTIGTLMFDKMDLSARFKYGIERYHTTAAIGSYKGIALTYKDLDRDIYEGEIESSWKLWPKYSWLVSGVYGQVVHDTGKKPDSEYYEVLTGLRGRPTSKALVEAKIGYRGQNYDSPGEDFDSIVFKGVVLWDVTAKDTIQLDFLRTTNATVYKDNAYYTSSYLVVGHNHEFTDRIRSILDFSYQNDKYSDETTEGTKTATRDDDFFSFGAGINYDLVKYFTLGLHYENRFRNSNFSSLDYDDNRYTVKLSGSF